MQENTYTYTNNREYRQLFRTVIGMENVPIPDYMVDEDEETLDEMNYDDTKAEIFISDIYEKTKHYTLFTELYEKASALMITTDYGVGLAILLSYDYFCDFYPFYLFFEKDPVNASKCVYYKNLIAKLCK